jgi:hypothetical protein
MAASDLINVNPNVLNSTIEFLTAMITPALLISATGSLVLSTSTRLGRVVDRVRALEVRLSEVITVEDKATLPLYDQRVEVIVELLDKVTSRSRILQRAMVAFYYGLGFFILTSVTIAIAGILSVFRWMPIPMGIVGIVFLFYGSLLMLREARMATATIRAEMDFTWQLARTVAPDDVISKYRNAYGRGKIRTKIHETLSGRRTDEES